ncbi:MAG: TonB family protein [Candidatus Acidiferrum sp.]
MTEGPKQWVGQVVDGIFPLRQYLGGSDHSAVFLTERGADEPRKAAIKLVPADAATADLQLARWSIAAQLSHPNVLRLFGTGRCRVAGNDILYLVMEHAEEDLADVLSERALTLEETRDMLGPVLDALGYLHGKGYLHGDLKPANILASGDRLKLSSETVSRIGESLAIFRRPGAYDPPEAISGMLTTAADVWSLGTTLVEVMTQRLPDWQPGSQREPLVPANIPAPFGEIARQCLRLEPQQRATLADIAARLNSRANVASASASASANAPVSASSFTASVPVPGPSLHVGTGQASAAVSRPMASMQLPPRAAARMQSNPHRPPPYKGPGKRSRFLVPLAIGALAFAAILTVPRLLTHHPKAKLTAAVTPARPHTQTATEKPLAPVASPKPSENSERISGLSESAKSAAPTKEQGNQQTHAAAAQGSLKTASEKERSVAPISSTPASGATENAGSASAGMVSAKGQVLDQVMPDVSPKARATIWGRVRVGIKIQVNEAGAVTDAELDSPGPSKYFADKALEAAKKWVFTPPEVNGKSVASFWSLRFVFSQSDTKVVPTQTAP